MNPKAPTAKAGSPRQVRTWEPLLESLRRDRALVAAGGGPKAIERQHEKKRLTARERVARLIDPDSSFFEFGRFSAWGMYGDWGPAPAASVLCGVGTVSGRRFMLVVNDATVKAGSFFPMTVKKVLRAQRIALVNRLPLIYLVDSAGVMLPLQEDVFPDEDDFGRIFRNNAVLSALGVPQIAAIMGNCVAGGGYLPVLCDKLIMTEGSGLYLAGPALVKSAIGQDVGHEELGGAKMHAAVSGTIDFREPDDDAGLARVRALAAMLPVDPRAAQFRRAAPVAPARSPEEVYQIVSPERQESYEVRDLLACIVDADTFQEYKADYGRTVICGYARIGGFDVGVLINQHHPEKTRREGLQYGGVIYHDSADKMARFIMDCNQTWTPLVFLQDVSGFMVGRDSEQSGIIRAGAKVVNAISNSRVPKLTVVLGGSYGAGNYAMCGKAFDPRFIFAWPTAEYAVMGSAQAASTLLDVTIAAMKKQGRAIDATELEEIRSKVTEAYDACLDPRYSAARGWVDEIIEPAKTRDTLIEALEVATRHADDEPFRTGVLQV
ncbi:MAG TPA: acyl-CoA carboxylase subunit beta [Planctomycetaceae bacterium]|jgi:acetyl-CoA carboxylase carboxyltransferase component|nr:acyl-CoA carboxylase subunit beta [Planctomycetaceae bacterium]